MLGLEIFCLDSLIGGINAFLSICMGVFLHMYMCTADMPGAKEIQKRALDLLGL